MDGVDPKIVVDVRVHRYSIDGVDDGVICKWRESFQVSQQLPAILQVGWAEMQNLLQVVVNPLAEWLVVRSHLKRR